MKEERKLFIVENNMIYDNDTNQVVGIIENGEMKLYNDIQTGAYSFIERTDDQYKPYLVFFIFLGYVSAVLTLILLLGR